MTEKNKKISKTASALISGIIIGFFVGQASALIMFLLLDIVFLLKMGG